MKKGKILGPGEFGNHFFYPSKNGPRDQNSIVLTKIDKQGSMADLNL